VAKDLLHLKDVQMPKKELNHLEKELDDLKPLMDDLLKKNLSAIPNFGTIEIVFYQGQIQDIFAGYRVRCKKVLCK
jgi:hypothetical protein